MMIMGRQFQIKNKNLSDYKKLQKSTVIFHDNHSNPSSLQNTNRYKYKSLWFLKLLNKEQKANIVYGIHGRD